MDSFLVVVSIYAVMSIITLIAFVRDKRAASQGMRRTPEAVLHLLELFGGWPGALLAFVFVRHKNRKLSYLFVTALIVIVHLAAGWLALHVILHALTDLAAVIEKPSQLQLPAQCRTLLFSHIPQR